MVSDSSSASSVRRSIRTKSNGPGLGEALAHVKSRYRCPYCTYSFLYRRPGRPPWMVEYGVEMPNQAVHCPRCEEILQHNDQDPGSQHPHHWPSQDQPQDRQQQEQEQEQQRRKHEEPEQEPRQEQEDEEQEQEDEDAPWMKLSGEEQERQQKMQQQRQWRRRSYQSPHQWRQDRPLRLSSPYGARAPQVHFRRVPPPQDDNLSISSISSSGASTSSDATSEAASVRTTATGEDTPRTDTARTARRPSIGTLRLSRPSSANKIETGSTGPQLRNIINLRRDIPDFLATSDRKEPKFWKPNFWHNPKTPLTSQGTAQCLIVQDSAHYMQDKPVNLACRKAPPKQNDKGPFELTWLHIPISKLRWDSNYLEEIITDCPYATKNAKALAINMIRHGFPTHRQAPVNQSRGDQDLISQDLEGNASKPAASESVTMVAMPYVTLKPNPGTIPELQYGQLQTQSLLQYLYDYEVSDERNGKQIVTDYVTVHSGDILQVSYLFCLRISTNIILTWGELELEEAKGKAIDILAPAVMVVE